MKRTGRQCKAIILHVLDRDGFLKTKLFGYSDRTTPDFEDLKNLKPTAQELRDALDWVKARDALPNWPSHCETAFAVLRKALGYD
jgi:hypothetical protein